MGLGSVSWDILIPSGVRLLVVLLVVVWPTRACTTGSALTFRTFVVMETAIHFSGNSNRLYSLLLKGTALPNWLVYDYIFLW
jgi:hypothetical protein